MIERDLPAKPVARNKTHIRFRRIATRAGIGLLIVGILAATTWAVLERPWNPDQNPISAAVDASMKFPLYYPRSLPEGYRIDKHSTYKPKPDVLVYKLVGPDGGEIFISQEARQPKFDLGGFYKQLTDLKMTGVSDGSVAVGHNQGRLIGSRANNTTWILANTVADVPEDQFTDMLKSFKPTN